MKRVNDLLNLKDLVYPALFRVLISLLIIYDIGSNLFFARDVYVIKNLSHHIDEIWSVAVFFRKHIYIFLLLYLIVLGLFLRGIGIYFTAALVFLFTYLDHMLIHPAIFWGDHILRITLIYFIFTDAYRYFAKYSDKDQPGLLHALSLLSIKFNFCLIYFSNAWYKWWSDDWTSGYALGYFFNSAEVMDIFGIGEFLMQFPDLIRYLTWFVLFFQTTFPVFIWFRKLKWFWIFTGIIMHVIMAITLQLYKFELIMILLYGFFITDREWQFILGKFKVKLDLNRRS